MHYHCAKPATYLQLRREWGANEGTTGDTSLIDLGMSTTPAVSDVVSLPIDVKTGRTTATPHKKGEQNACSP
ncbi:hypothetical protein HYPDE_28068 [Hyphomicrobium denitrificans 1NES1]|uniref:Uncharacterized protein n=1 Tax=Hyphomicrobium denitrificans 1NES1 TaxID=670307 RepID=N0B2S3_9HYPH|nr:hypothetical protein HYPDE_28068 [Hyphomicrobium denitrificans 1NES1]